MTNQEKFNNEVMPNDIRDAVIEEMTLALRNLGVSENEIEAAKTEALKQNNDGPLSALLIKHRR